jgi:CBS domain-containing protein
MKIKDVMTPHIESVSPSDTIRYAAQKMDEFNIGAIPVTKDKRLVGFLTDRDITVRAVAQGLSTDECTVSDIMTEDCVCCNENSNINEAVRLMEERKIRRILVTNDKDQVVGILSLGDLAVKLSEQQACEVLREVSKPARPER